MAPLTVLALGLLAVISLAGSAVVPASSSQNGVTYGDKTVIPFYLDGVDVTLLSEEELRALVEEDDERVKTELDLLVGAKIVAARREITRPKRWIPLAARGLWAAGRALFGSSTRGALSRSGARLTQQYKNPGTFKDAVNHFQNLRPGNVKTLPNNKGMTGSVGNHRVTVRNTSTDGSPTLEIRSPSSRTGTDTFVRKFRFEKDPK